MASLDSGGDGPVMLALHGSFDSGAIFNGLTADLRGLVRVVAPDQRPSKSSGRSCARLRSSARSWTCAARPRSARARGGPERGGLAWGGPRAREVPNHGLR